MDFLMKKQDLGDIVRLAQEKKFTAKSQFANSIEESVLSRHDHKVRDSRHYFLFTTLSSHGH